MICGTGHYGSPRASLSVSTTAAPDATDWAHCPDSPHEALDVIVAAMQNGQSVPLAMHELTTVFIPQADISADLALVKPLQPITLVLTSEMLICMVINNALPQSWHRTSPPP